METRDNAESDAVQRWGGLMTKKIEDPRVSEQDIAAYQRDGALCLRGVFTDWITTLNRGVARNVAAPGPYGSDNLGDGEGGRFFDRPWRAWQRTTQPALWLCHPLAR